MAAGRRQSIRNSIPKVYQNDASMNPKWTEKGAQSRYENSIFFFHDFWVPRGTPPGPECWGRRRRRHPLGEKLYRASSIEGATSAADPNILPECSGRRRRRRPLYNPHLSVDNPHLITWSLPSRRPDTPLRVRGRIKGLRLCRRPPYHTS